METFYDTHAHLTFPDFANDIPALLERAQAAGITRVISIGTDLTSSRQAVALAEAHEEVYAVVGWHPNDLESAPDDVRPELRPLCEHPKVVAVSIPKGLAQVAVGKPAAGRCGQDALRQVCHRRSVSVSEPA